MLHRIACVELDPDNREILELALTVIGKFETFMFGDCEEALFEVPALRPDFILLNPGFSSQMTGVELCAYFKDNPYLKDVPMAFLSSRVLRTDMLDLERLAPVICKPFDPMDLPRRIREIHSEVSAARPVPACGPVQAYLRAS